MVDTKIAPEYKGPKSFAEGFVEKHNVHVRKDAQLPSADILKKAFGSESVPEELTDSDRRELAEAAYILFLERQEVKKEVQRMDTLTVSECIQEAEQRITDNSLPLITDLGQAERVHVTPTNGQTTLTEDQQRVATIRTYVRTKLREREEQRASDQETGSTASLQDRLSLIRQGRAGALLAQVRTEAPADARKAQAAERIHIIEDQLLAIFQVPGVLEEYQAGFERERAGINKAREVLQLRQFFRELTAMEDRIERTAWSEGRSISVLEQQDFAENVEIRKAIQERVDELLLDQEAIDALRVMELQEYKKQMNEDGFAETPSRELLVSKIRAQVAKGAKVLMIGESGTGKTELWFHSSRSLFGTKGHSVTGGPDLSMYAIYGTKGMTKDGDVARQGPFTKSLIDRDGKGSPFLYDEINNSNPEQLMSMKTALNAVPGDEIEIPIDTEHEYIAGQDWAFGATMNPKSVRYRSRQDLDPAVKRLLTPIPVDYMPPDELFDIFLATLMDNRGGAPLTLQDAMSTLYHFTEGIGWAQAAFAGKKVVIDQANETPLFDRNGASRGELATLKKTIIDPGRARAMLLGYEKSRAQGKPLIEHLNNELYLFINDQDLPEDDRYYLIQIFTLKGFFGTADWRADRFNLSILNDQTLDGWKQGTRAAILGKPITPKDAYISRQTLATIDPYHKKRGGIQDDMAALLGDEFEAATVFVNPQQEAIQRAQAEIDQINQAQDWATLFAIIGNVRDNSKHPSTHEAYVRRVDALQRSGVLDADFALNALGEYGEVGAWGPGSAIDVRSIANDLELALREQLISQAPDLKKLDDYMGGVDQTRLPSTTHAKYLKRVEEIGRLDPQSDVALDAVGALDLYGQIGAWRTTLNNLQAEAVKKATSLRILIINASTDINRMANEVLGGIDNRTASAEAHKTYLQRLETFGRTAQVVAASRILDALDHYGERGAYSNTMNDLRADAIKKATALRNRLMTQTTDLNELAGLVGNVTERTTGTEVHKTYLNRLNELGKMALNTGNDGEFDRVLEALDYYSSVGAFSTTLSDLRNDAKLKSTSLRKQAILAELDPSRLTALVNGISSRNTDGEVHKIYVNRLDSLLTAGGPSQPDFRGLLQALEDYASMGAYSTTLNDLQALARTKVKTIKQRFNIT